MCAFVCCVILSFAVYIYVCVPVMKLLLVLCDRKPLKVAKLDIITDSPGYSIAHVA